MARRLRTFQTSIGFFDLAIAAPSMKAALEAWGANSNLFRQGFAKEIDDPEVVAAAMSKPGVVLRRAVGTSNSFVENADLPKASQVAGARERRSKPPRRESTKRPAREQKTNRRALQAFKKEEARRKKEQEKEAAAERLRKTRSARAVAHAEQVREKGRRRHEGALAKLAKKRAALERLAKVEEDRWERERHQLDDRVRRERLG